MSRRLSCNAPYNAPATALNEGVEQRTCKHDASHVQTRSIAATGVKGVLLAKMTLKGKRSIELTWSKVEGAEGYDVFFAPCNTAKKHASKKAATLKGADQLSWTKNGLKKGIAYKAYVRAWAKKAGQKVYVKRSPTLHGFAGGYSATYTNAKRVVVKQASVSLAAGASHKIEASVVKLKKDRKLISSKHAPTLRYLSANPKVARVTSAGKIVARAAGSCKVYVYAANGTRKTVRVTVR